MELKEYLTSLNGLFVNEDVEKSKATIENRYYRSKVEFIVDSEIADNSAVAYIRRFLNYTLPMENVMKKDLYEMNIDKIRLVIKSIGTTSISQKKNMINLVKIYIEWAYKKGYRTTASDLYLLDEEDLASIDSKRLEKNYISKDKLYTLCNYAVNNGAEANAFSPITASDCVIILLCRYGLLLEEAMEIEDIMINEEEMTINFYNEDYKKTIKIDKELLTYIEVARQENDGKIIKYNKINSNRNRMKVFFSVCSVKRMSPTNLINSQMVDDLDAIYEEKGEVKVKDVQKIKRKYEPKCSNSSYTSLKLLWSNLRGVDVLKDKPGKVSIKTKRDIIKELLAELD